ncbi:MAG: protein kinase [Deltaproteobacteria bacterium]|nr:protein kinase [Deltaproteobacteria bacterium]
MSQKVKIPPLASCLEAEDVAALLEGTLEDKERQHVEAHMGDCGSCRRLVAEAARSLRAPKEEDEGQKVAIGDRIDHYQILKLLGRGGMGEVYLAQDHDLGRQVALKMLTTHAVADDNVLARFFFEARTLARLTHPNIVTIYAVGEHQGRAFLVLQYVAGQSLRRYLSGGPRSQQEVLKIATGVARALCAAHDAQILHRDLKPENVMVGNDGEVRVLDFGLARSTASHGAEADPFLSVDGVRGTPMYMAPEQWRGVAEASADIWAFGLMLRELITGRVPDAEHLSRKMLAGPPELRELTQRCTETDPARRPTARELLLALELMQAPSAGAQRSSRAPLALMLILLGVVVAIASWFVLREGEPARLGATGPAQRDSARAASPEAGTTSRQKTSALDAPSTAKAPPAKAPPAKAPPARATPKRAAKVKGRKGASKHNRRYVGEGLMDF